MTKPPKTTTHSDIDGVHEDERPSVDTAAEKGQGGRDLERAAEQDVARPPHSDVGAGSGERPE